MSSSKPLVTVIMVTYNRPAMLRGALQSLLNASERVPFCVSLRLMVNGHDEASHQTYREMEKSLSRLNPTLQLMQVAVTPAEARNKLSENMTSPWVFYVDDDVIIPDDLLSHFGRLIEKFPEVDVWGGPNLTPVESEQVALCNGWFVQNSWVVGPVAKRYKRVGDEKRRASSFNLMLCNLFLKSEILHKHRFVSTLKTAEENELIYQLQRDNKILSFSDHLYVWHERRPTFKGFLRQIFYYGYGRGQLLVRGPILSQLHFLFFIFFVLNVLAMAFLWPLVFVTVLLCWSTLIYLGFTSRFRRLNVFAFFLPALIWIAYTAGLGKGVYLGLGISREDTA